MHVTEKEIPKNVGPHLFFELSLSFSLCTWQAYRETEVSRSIIQKYLQMHKARHRQVGTWPLCLSAFQCVCGVNIYFTLIYTSKGKKDVPVTFSKCQVWREEERIRRERAAGDLGDLSMYALHNVFIYPGEIDRERSLSETYWPLHTYSHNFTQRASQYI